MNDSEEVHATERAPAGGAAHEPASAAFLRHISQLEKGECCCCRCCHRYFPTRRPAWHLER
jgi:hypothetical protein